MGWPKWVFDFQSSLVFVHTPKAGGTSVVRSILHALPPASLCCSPTSVVKLESAMQQCQPADWPSMDNRAHVSEAFALACLHECLNITRSTPVLTFALVRNPMDVRISAWHYLSGRSRRSRLHSGKALYKRRFNEYITSYDFQRFPADHGAFVSSFGLPQHTFVGPCTALFATEHIDRLWSFLQQEYYPTLRPAHANAAIASAQRPNISADARRVVERVFAEDYALHEALIAHGGALLPPCAQKKLDAQRALRRASRSA